jgi:hypothetical protein
MAEFPPNNSYLAIRYRDAHRGIETRYVYYEDGRVEAFIENKWLTLCVFNTEQIAQAKSLIHSSGLLEVSDIDAEGFYDTASYVYYWSLDGQSGSVVNAAYPAKSDPAFRTLERGLDELESVAREASD